MITVTNVALQYGERKLFEDVNLKFTPGNCYGVIGANGAGKSTFLKIIAGEIEPDAGKIVISSGMRMSILKQDHYQYDQCVVIDAVIMGNQRLYEIIKEKEALYSKADFSDEDGMKVANLEHEFNKMNGWVAESEAATMLHGLGIETDLHHKILSELQGAEKVKVLLAQALFGNPGILILDEPTNHLDMQAISWLEEFLIAFKGIVIVVTHDRHFVNNICTHMADVDYGSIKLYAGNYDFWYESSQLALQMLRDQNKKKEEKQKQLQEFITRFSANASKSKQATSRKKILEKINLDDIQPSNRKYPYVGFKADREVGSDILTVVDLCKTIDGEKVLNKVSFTVHKGDKIAFVGTNEIAYTTLLRILSGELEPDSGYYKWGVTITKAYFPKDSSPYFQDQDLNLIDWLRQYSSDKADLYVRGFLGKMLFSGEEALKPLKVLSGGERVRCMLAKIMLCHANVLLLDQPTNHLDLETITALNNGLHDYNSNILFTSHDRQLVETIANRIIELTSTKMLDVSLTYDEYLESIAI